MSWLRIFAVVIGIGATAAALGAPPDSPQGSVDSLGDPLPAGAIARFGTVRLQPRRVGFIGGVFARRQNAGLGR